MTASDAPTGAHRCPSCTAVLRLLGERGSHLMLRCVDGHEFEWSSAHGYLEQPHPVRSERLAGAAYRAELLTAQLRDSPTGLYASLRTAINGIGLDANTTQLTEFFPDGPAQHRGALVTDDRRVLTFVLRTNSAFTHRDRTHTWEQVPHNAGLEAVLLALDEE